MDDEAAEHLDNYDGNQSELVSNLVKEYFTRGVYDEELAADKLRKRVIERQVAEMESELENLRSELSDLEALDDDTETSSIEEAASELEIFDPERIHANNGAIVKKAEANGIEPAVLADEVMRQYRQHQAEELASVEADD